MIIALVLAVFLLAVRLYQLHLQILTIETYNADLQRMLAEQQARIWKASEYTGTAEDKDFWNEDKRGD